MANLILILGGVRSGKSKFAEKLASSGKKVAYIATAQVLDEEMRIKIENHKNNRPKEWLTLEAPHNLKDVLSKLDKSVDMVVIDCLTVYVANLMGLEEDKVFSEIKDMLKIIKDLNSKIIMVSNEVGMGVVPPYESGRKYRDMLGQANQIVAEAADEVYLMVAGIPVKVK